MSQRSSLLKYVLAAALAFSFVLPAQQAAAAACQAQIDRELQRISVPAEAIASMKVVKRSRGAKSASNFVHEAWIRLKACEKGYLIINMTSACKVQESYTYGDCSLEGVKNY